MSSYHCACLVLDGLRASPYSETSMAVKTIRLGQVWRRDEDGQNYLVTRVFNEVFTQFAVMRPAELNAPDAPTVKVKVAKDADGCALPGYTFTQNE
jgi:hypothetical protein